jgi:hypothetical protein
VSRFAARLSYSGIALATRAGKEKPMKKWIDSIAVLAGLALTTSLALAEDVTMDQLPEPVRRTIQEEIGSAQIGEIERDREGDRTYYEVEFVENGRRFELDIAANGQVLRRHAD